MMCSFPVLSGFVADFLSGFFFYCTSDIELSCCTAIHIIISVAPCSSILCTSVLCVSPLRPCHISFPHFFFDVLPKMLWFLPFYLICFSICQILFSEFFKLIFLYQIFSFFNLLRLIQFLRLFQIPVVLRSWNGCFQQAPPHPEVSAFC